MFDPLLFLKTVPNQPGVYCMHNAREQVIYVGKAKDLQKRLASYFRGRGHSLKTQTLVAAIATINITVTHTETEALLLEQTYIKQYQPRYNVLLRNDASYPYLLLTKERHPRLVYHRGAQRIPGEYFGPFVNAKALHETLTFLQRVFCLRQCENSVYRHRSRPCLQYQIGRCLGPCVTGLVTDVAYQQQVEHVRLFLQGKNQQVITALVKQMESASQALQFERSAQIRDQIQAIRKIIEKQHVAGKPDIQLDAISIAYEAGIAAVQVLFLRHGHLMGSQTYFPRVPPQTPLEEIVQTFISQFYLQSNAIHSCTARELPASILVDLPLPDGQSLAASLSEIAGHTVKIQNQPRGERAHYLKLAHTNALNALNTKLTHQSMIRNRLHLLSKLLAVPTIHRLECFDISHTLGQQTVAACVVFNANGPLKADYRRYNVTDITPGDDCAAIAYVLKRRYAKPLQPEKIPQVIIIDGGKGQLNAAIKVFKTLNIAWNQAPPLLLSIAKGPQRKAGAETLFLTPTGHGIKLPAESAALHLIQHLRDEAHRYAIIGHRQRRNKAKTTSILQQITGIGPKRRQALLKYMGGLKPLLTATVEQIANVPTISQKLAEKIYVSLRQG